MMDENEISLEADSRRKSNDLVWASAIVGRFLADRTATQCDRLLAFSCRLSVRTPSVCDAMHPGSQGRCTGLKLYQRVLSRHIPICLFRHFCCRMSFLNSFSQQHVHGVIFYL